MKKITNGKKILDQMLKVRTSYPADVLKSREVLAREAPEYLELFHKTYLYVLNERSALSPKMKELIIIAADSMQFYERGMRSHMASALKLGATSDEIVDTLLAASIAGGIHVLSVALPIFDDVINAWRKNQEKARKSKKLKK